MLVLFVFKSIVQCGENEGVICGKASKWESNGTFVTTDNSVYEPSLEPVVESLKFGLIFFRFLPLSFSFSHHSVPF